MHGFFVGHPSPAASPPLAMENSASHQGGMSPVSVMGSTVGLMTPDDPQSIVADGSVDLRGRPVRRDKTGGWKACYFIFGQEVAERITYYGIVVNLVVYLTVELRQGLATAAKNVNNWNGAVFIFPFLGGFLADAYLGRYWTIVAFSLVYIAASLMLTSAVSLPSLRPPKCPVDVSAEACPKASSGQFAFFYLALYLMAIGNGGMKPCVSALGADQFDEEDAKENKQKLSFFNWWYVGIGVGVLFAITVVVYIQDNVSWGWGYGIPTFALGLGMLVFLLGTRLYRHKKPVGSPMTQFAQVIVAAIRNRNVSVPSSADLLHENEAKHYLNSGRRKVLHTDTVRFLDKAATYNAYSGLGGVGEVEASPWRLCTVTQVEEVKVFVRMFPIWVTNLMFQTVYAQVSTFFIKQAATLDLRLGPHFTIPAASITVFLVLPYLFTIVAYDRMLVPLLKRWTGHPRGVPIVVKMGAGIALSVVAMVVAALTERKRQDFARDHGLLVLARGAFLPMSVFWLVPQFVIMSMADSLAIVGEMEFFYDQAPDHMKSLGTAFFLSMTGVGNFLSTAIIDITNDVTGRNGNHPWIGKNLNTSKLDHFYWMLAGLSAINMAAYVYFAYTYSSRTTESQAIKAPEGEDGLDQDQRSEDKILAL